MRSITESVFPPRAVFTDYPLGRTAGKPNDPDSQDAIVGAAIDHLWSAESAGEVRWVDLHWAGDDDWKDGVMRPKSAVVACGAAEVEDDRAERTEVPQYQFEGDRVAVEADCPTCCAGGARDPSLAGRPPALGSRRRRGGGMPSNLLARPMGSILPKARACGQFRWDGGSPLR